MLLVVACLGAALPAVAVAQSPGDRQYADPFADEGGSQRTTTDSGSSGSNRLSPTPQAPRQRNTPSSSGSSGSSGTVPSSGSRGASSSGSAGRTLPDTGVDARLLLLVGVAVLLTGLGLRLRSAPERF